MTIEGTSYRKNYNRISTFKKEYTKFDKLEVEINKIDKFMSDFAKYQEAIGKCENNENVLSNSIKLESLEDDMHEFLMKKGKSLLDRHDSLLGQIERLEDKFSGSEFENECMKLEKWKDVLFKFNNKEIMSLTIASVRKKVKEVSREKSRSRNNYIMPKGKVSQNISIKLGLY